MNGYIKTLSIGHASGFIAADDGLTLFFQSSAVMEYDVACLAVGQLVTFDVEEGASPKVMNVSVRKSHPAPSPADKSGKAVFLRYLGFEQSGGARSYRFERISAAEDKKTFLITAEMSLFLKHHIGIQEGPALCLHLLSEALGKQGPTEASSSRSWLTDTDMLAHIASRPVPPPKRGRKHPPSAPVESPQNSRIWPYSS